uniref:Uncharacterized protein n=1 Tax=Anguilla anguilla TaxID=7936 RepID=A0A0E9PRR9_ANGAN
MTHCLKCSSIYMIPFTLSTFSTPDHLWRWCGVFVQYHPQYNGRMAGEF